MFTTQEPVIGTWFVNQTGKLIKVKLLVYSESGLERIMVEYLDGLRKVIHVDDWFCLKLNKQIHDASVKMQLH